MAKKQMGANLMEAMPKPSKQDQEYETQGHLDTLNKAADIMGDPTKMQKVHKLAGRRHAALMGMMSAPTPPKINSLDDLKKVAYAKKPDQPAPDDDEDDQ